MRKIGNSVDDVATGIGEASLHTPVTELKANAVAATVAKKLHVRLETL